MAYKDKDKQREAQREWVRQKRAAKGSTEQGSTQGVTAAERKQIEKDFMVAIGLRPVTKLSPKRGKVIKCADLPPDVQATINRVSESNEEKAKRTAAAIKYQHLFPDRYHNTRAAKDKGGAPEKALPPKGAGRA